MATFPGFEHGLLARAASGSAKRQRADMGPSCVGSEKGLGFIGFRV